MDHVDAIAVGAPRGGAFAALAEAEHSRRLVLLRVLLGWARRDGADGGPLGSVEEAWTLLGRAEQSDPGIVREVLMDPHIGLWLSCTLRGWRQPVDGTPRWVHLGHLRALAAAAAIRSKLDFTITVPTRHGDVVLPDLGTAQLGLAGGWGTAEVKSRNGSVAVCGNGVVVDLPEDCEQDGTGWLGLRRLRAVAAGRQLTVSLNDLDPYQLAPGMEPPQRLSSADADRWQDLFEQAWDLLTRDHPGAADVLATGLRSVLPLPPGNRFRPRSGSSGDGFGGALISLPDDAAQLAVTLIHEFRHSTLSAVMHLTALHDQGDTSLYAPWRDDPRPLSGLFQGVYAFMGVTDFWRLRRKRDTGTAARLADFEFALWLRQTRTAWQTVNDSPALTPLGRRFSERVGECLTAWEAELEAGGEHDAGLRSAVDHQASWGAHHLQVSPDVVEAAVEAWLAGALPPASVPLSEPAQVRADPEAAWLDVTAILHRWRIVDPSAFGDLFEASQSTETMDAVVGATSADVAWVAGDIDRAYDLYLAEASRPADRASAWPRLAQVAAARGEHQLATVLLERPELVRAVRKGIMVRVRGEVTPSQVAQWLGRQ